MAAVVARLKALHEKVGDVGVAKLLHAAKKEGLAVNKQIVQDYLSTDAPAQIFKPLPHSQGKTGAEAQGWRVQADLIDYKTRKARWQGNEYSVVLCIIDVMSRRLWAAPCKSKSPAHVAPVMRRLLGEMQAAAGIGEIAVMSTDQGNEFKNDVAEVLEDEGVIHRSVDKQDPNQLAVLDRAIQTFKRRMAQSLAKNKAPWPSRVAQIAKQYNNTVHPAIRDEPEDFNKPGHGVKRFLAAQDNAEALEFNQKLLEKRKAALERQGGYRVPEGGINKFRRSFYQSYSSDVKEPTAYRGSKVVDQHGEATDVKRVIAVNVFSGHAEQGLDAASNPRRDKAKDIMLDAMALLYAYLEPGQTISLSEASRYLREEMGDKLKEDLRRAHLQRLVQAVELFDQEFEVQPGGYFVKRLG